MLRIQQFRYADDNLGYLIYGPKRAMAVDGGAAEESLEFVRAHRLTLSYVTSTHSHPDHICGDKALLRKSDALLFSAAMSAEKGLFVLDGEPVRVVRSPGHSADAVIFETADILLTGDTLFNGTIGNCFSGDMTGFFSSLKILMAYPKETLIYAGHDYVAASMAFAKFLEPDNRDIDAYLAEYTPGHVRSRLSDEFKVNPYLRFNSPAIVHFLESRGLRVGTEFERWESLMSIE